MEILDNLKKGFDAALARFLPPAVVDPRPTDPITQKVVHTDYAKFVVTTTVDKEQYSLIHRKTFTFGLNFIQHSDGSRQITVDPGITQEVSVGETNGIVLNLKKHPIWPTLAKWATSDIDINITDDLLEWEIHV